MRRKENNFTNDIKETVQIPNDCCVTVVERSCGVKTS